MSLLGNLFKKKQLETKPYNYRPFDVYDTDNYLVKDYIEIARSAYSPELLKNNRQLMLYITSVASKDTPTIANFMGKESQIVSRFGDLDVKEDRILSVLDFMHTLSKMSSSEAEKWIDEVVFPKDFMNS